MRWSKRAKTGYQYSDIHKDFVPSLKDDISIVTDAKSIEQQISGIIMTRRGECPLDPEFGCNLSNILFENMNDGTQYLISQQILEAIRQYEPRVEKVDVQATAIYDTNQVIVTIQYFIKSVNEQQTLEYELSAQ